MTDNEIIMLVVDKINSLQEEAIKCEDEDILVSASAGTGKTNVLASRIAYRVCKGELDLDRVLVTTFTKSAAEEMRGRIGDAIKKAIDKTTDPDLRTKLRKQYGKLAHAEIGTIDSFMLHTVQKYFARLGIPADSSICDESIAARFFTHAVDNAIYKAKGGADHDVISSLEFLQGGMNDFSKQIKRLYEKLEQNDDGIAAAFDTTLKAFETAKGDFFATEWGKHLIENAVHNLEYCSSALKIGIDEMTDTENTKIDAICEEWNKLANLVGAVINQLENGSVERAVNTYKTDICGQFKTTFPKKGNKDYYDGFSEYFEDVKKIKAALVSAAKSGDIINIFASLEAAASFPSSAAYEKCVEVVKDVKNIMIEIENSYFGEMTKKGLLTYASTTRLCKNLLSENPDIAKEIADKYEEIYIDEYQDVSRIQDSVFTIIKNKGSKRFMVGDVKQSIYAFRNSDPKIFIEHRGNENIAQKYLRENYRSGKEVLDFANGVCTVLLSSCGENSVYDKEKDDLVYGSDKIKSDIVPKIVAISTPYYNKDMPDGFERGDYEAGYVARTIKENVKNREYDKFCVLVRENKHAEPFKRIFDKYGIPYDVNADENLLDFEDVSLVVSLLNVIDNPSGDLALTAVLHSPLFNFTLSEIVDIRYYKRDGTLYGALKEYAENTGNEKCHGFIKKLEEYRKKAVLPVDEFLSYLYTDTGIYSISPKCSARESTKAHLNAFHNLALNFKSQTNRGLYPFISHINELIATGEGLKVKRVSPKGCVKIMTMHGSKGLQFDTVFIAGIGRSKKDANEDWTVDEKGVLTSKIFDDTKFRLFAPPSFSAAKDRKKNNELADEARLIYVALTRAERNLYIVGEVKWITENKPPYDEKLFALDKMLMHGASDFILSEAKTALEKIILCAPDTYKVDYIAYNELPELDVTAETEETAEAVGDYSEKTEKTREKLKSRIEYKYKPTTKVNTKISVSRLSPTLFDDDGTVELKPEKVKVKAPSFVKKTVSATDKGTATHAFMQYADFASAAANGVENEINRLVSKRFITAEMGALIDKKKIDGFLRSETYKKIASSPFVKREHRFFVSVPASELTTDEGKKEKLEGVPVLVQGIVDIIFENPDGTLTVLDYKTDSKKSMDNEEFEAELKTRHAEQLHYYKRAAERIFAKHVSRTAIYSFDLAREIEV